MVVQSSVGMTGKTNPGGFGLLIGYRDGRSKGLQWDQAQAIERILARLNVRSIVLILS